MFLVCETKSPSMSDFLTGLENSGWLRHIKAVMDAGVFLAKVKLCADLQVNLKVFTCHVRDSSKAVRQSLERRWENLLQIGPIYSKQTKACRQSASSQLPNWHSELLHETK